MQQYSDKSGSTAERIVALHEARVPDFIRDQINAKTLHRTIRSLNEDILDGDPARRAAARRAISRLGFL